MRNSIIDDHFDSDSVANWTPNDANLMSNPSENNAYIEATASVRQDMS